MIFRKNINMAKITCEPPDHFRTINVDPTLEDIFVKSSPFIRPNIVKGNYPDEKTYLDIQFRLLREDFYQPLRSAIVEYRRLVRTKIPVKEIDNVYLYNDVRISCNERNRNFRVQFSEKTAKGINWNTSKRLIYGSLLCLSSDNFKSVIFLTVFNSRPEALAEGRLSARYLGDIHPRRYQLENAFVMIEPSAHFESFRGTLKALQNLPLCDFSLRDFILAEINHIPEPDYLATKQSVINEKKYLNAFVIELKCMYKNIIEIF